MAGVRITLESSTLAGSSPQVIATDTFATPAAAVAGIATGFLIVTPNPDTAESADVPAIQAINVTKIVTIVQSTV